MAAMALVEYSPDVEARFWKSTMWYSTRRSPASTASARSGPYCASKLAHPGQLKSSQIWMAGAAGSPSAITPVSVISIRSSAVSPKVIGLASPPRWAIQTTPPNTTTATAINATTVMIIPLLDLDCRTLVFLLPVDLAFTWAWAFLCGETVDLPGRSALSREYRSQTQSTLHKPSEVKCTAPPVGGRPGRWTDCRAAWES